MRGAWMGAAALVLAAAGTTRVEAQGWIEPPPTVVASGVEKTRSEVRVRLDGRVAHVVVDEWFRNGGARVAEGHYLYPLPGEAVFQGFSLFQGEVELRGEIMDADRARGIYEEIVRRRLDPALIELAGHGLLRARVFPIEPGEERRVTLRYTQVLTRAGNALQLTYAGGVGHGGAARPASGDSPEVADGVRHSPVRTRFEVVTEEGDAFLDPFSPTHAVEAVREGRRLTVRVPGPIEGRLALFLPLSGEAVGLALATHRPIGEDGYFMLTLSPGRDPGRPEPRDVTVVVDVSGSMSGEKIEQARAALREILASLAAEDRFRLVAFSNAVRPHAEAWSPARGPALEGARRWVDALVADGGTNIEGALDEAFRLESPPARLPVVIFLTDGLPSVGEQSPERLADRAETSVGRARVFAFGVGHDVNTHLLDRLGEVGRGSTEYVQPGENVERAVSLLAAKVRHPVLTDLELGDAPVRLTEIHPVHIPDVFVGEELVLFGRYTGAGTGTVTIEGRRAGRAARFGARVEFPAVSEANAYIPRLWASRKLGHLTRQIWTEGETPDLVAEIRSVALRYGLPSPYTSYLVTEPGMVVAGRPEPAVPAGGGAMSPAAASGATAVRLAAAARSLRDASSMEALDEVERRARAALPSGTDARALAGRTFRREGGVWVDAGHAEGRPVIEIRSFSTAWFRMLEVLPELRPIVEELGSVVVAGGRVSIRVGDGGRETLDDEEAREMAMRFRQPAGAP